MVREQGQIKTAFGIVHWSARPTDMDKTGCDGLYVERVEMNAKKQKGESMKQLLPILYGGGSAGEWTKLEPFSYAELLQAGRCNSNLIEGFASTYSTEKPWVVNKTVEEVVEQMAQWIKAMSSRDIWTVIHLVNGGDESIRFFGAAFVCQVIDMLALKVGVDKIVLVAVAEHKNQPDHQLITQHAEDVWHDQYGGLIGFNGGGREQTVPNVKYVINDYHTQSQGDFGPSGNFQTLLDTDNGQIINSLRGTTGYWDVAKVRAWAEACKDRGRGINLYQSGSYTMQPDVFAAIGEIYNPAPLPIPVPVPIPDPVPDPVPVPIPPAVNDDKLKHWWSKIQSWFKKVFGW